MKTPQFLRLTRMSIVTLKKQAGMTLMEIIAALAIIASVVVGALVLFNSAQSSNTSVTMLKDIIALRSAMQQLYTGQGGYAGAAGGAGHTQLQNARKVPTDLIFISAAAGFRTPWGGTLTILPTAAPAPNFEITLTSVPVDVCTQLVTSASNGWQRVTIGAANLTAFPVTPALANTNCSTAAAGTTIVWRTVN